MLCSLLRNRVLRCVTFGLEVPCICVRKLLPVSWCESDIHLSASRRYRRIEIPPGAVRFRNWCLCTVSDIPLPFINSCIVSVKPRW